MKSLTLTIIGKKIILTISPRENRRTREIWEQDTVCYFWMQQRHTPQGHGVSYFPALDRRIKLARPQSYHKISTNKAHPLCSEMRDSEMEQTHKRQVVDGPWRKCSPWSVRSWEYRFWTGMGTCATKTSATAHVTEDAENIFLLQKSLRSKQRKHQRIVSALIIQKDWSKRCF